jgi:hypothetical protein
MNFVNLSKTIFTAILWFLFILLVVPVIQIVIYISNGNKTVSCYFFYFGLMMVLRLISLILILFLNKMSSPSFEIFSIGIIITS